MKLCSPQDFADQKHMALDEAICQALSTDNGGGWPIWITPGKGGDLPNRPEHDFKWHSLQEGARIDFCRGTVSDDPGNGPLARIVSRIPVLLADYGISHTNINNLGNMLDAILGISYAAKTGG